MRRYGIMLVLLVLLVLPATALSHVPVFPGDDAFARMEYTQAVHQYDSVMHVQMPHADLFWRLCRVHIAIGDVTEGDERV